MPPCINYAKRRNRKKALYLGLLFFGIQTTSLAAHNQSKLDGIERPRAVSVRIYGDAGFEKRPDWKQVARRRLAHVSALYRNNFNIEFKIVNFESWSPKDVNDLCQLTDQLLSLVKPNDPEVAIGYTTHIDSSTLGCSQGFTRAVVISDNGSYSEGNVEFRVAHELGHLFGGWHLPVASSVMYGFQPYPSSISFDRYNRQGIMLMRNFNFYKDVEGIDETTVKTFTNIYDKSPHFPESVNPISEAYVRLGNGLVIAGKNEDAILDYKKAVSIDVQNAEAHFYYGSAAAMSDDHQTALAEFCAAATQFLQRADRYIQERKRRDDAWKALCGSALSVERGQSIDPSNVCLASILLTLNDRRAAICPQCVCQQ